MKKYFPHTIFEVLYLLIASLLISSPFILIKELCSLGDYIIVFFFPVFVLIGLLIAKIANKKRKTAVLKTHFTSDRKSKYTFLLLVGSIIVAFQIMVNPIISKFISNLIHKEGSISSFTNLSLLSFVSMVIMAPIFEELLFRKIIFRGLLSKYKLKGAIIYTSIFFALIHFLPSQIIGAFLIGIMLTLLYFYSGNILYPIFFHSMANLLGILMMYLTEKFQHTVLFSSNYMQAIVLIIGVIVIYLLIKRLSVMIRELNQRFSLSEK